MKITSDYVLFWGGIYSQWYDADILLDDKVFNTCEQWMMYQKAMLFNDEEIAAKILSTSNPREQKALGRKVRGFDVDVWEKEARMIVYRGNYAKFTQHEYLYRQIMATGTRTFVEASPFDKIWGIGLEEDDPRCLDPAQWEGRNWLGQVLTKVRDELVKKKTDT